MPANLTHDALSEFGAVNKALVGKAQEHHLRYAKHLGGVELLLFPRSGKVGRVYGPVARAVPAVGCHHQNYVATLRSPFGDGAARASLGIVGMRRHHKHVILLFHDFGNVPPRMSA